MRQKRHATIDGQPFEWTRKKRHRHDCADHMPTQIPSFMREGDRVRCPTCRRRWELTDIYEDPPAGSIRIGMQHSEGVDITGPDGSIYWRPFRTRFIGGLFL